MLRIAAYSLICVLLSVASASAAMTGLFEERDVPSGATLQLAIDQGHVSGLLRLPNGKAYSLNGEQLGASAQGALKTDEGVRAFFFAEEGTGGLRLQFIPQNADKKPDIGKARSYVFVPRGTQHAQAKLPAANVIKTDELRPSVAENTEETPVIPARVPIAPPRH